jgi:general secretion pathway protein K
VSARRLDRQRGVAVITALLLTTLAVTIVASLFWQQQVQVRSMENQRLHLQTKWILRGALDWAQLVLRQDGQDHQFNTSLDQVWATPLAETRLDQYIERERIEGEVFDATLSGSIVDATSRYNLRNLAENGAPVPEQLAIFQRLLQNLQLDPALAERAAKAVASTQVATPTGDGGSAPPVQSSAKPMALIQLDDLLAVPGFTLEVVERLRKYVIVIQQATPVNVNTAAPEVIAALAPNYSVSEANGLVARRKQGAFRSVREYEAALGGATPVANAAAVRSDYFLVLSRVRLDRAALDAEALVWRKAATAPGGTSLVWVRQN